MTSSSQGPVLYRRGAKPFALDRLIPAELLAENDTRVRSRVLVAASLGLGLLGAVIVILRAISYPWGLSLAISALIVVVLLQLPWVQWITRSCRLAGGILSLVFLVFFPVLQVLVGVFPAPVLFLFALTPLTATFFVGVRFGGFAALTMAVAATALSTIVPHAADPALSPIMPTLTACAALMPLMVYCLAFFYERSRTLNEAELADVNSELLIARSIAETADRRKTEFLRHMSHDLRTPLNAILGYSEILLEEAHDRDDATQVEDLGHILSASEHLLRLINDLLDISRIEADAIELSLEEVPLIELVQEVERLVAPLAQAGGNTVTLEVEPTATVRSDRKRLTQILINLVGNACKFTEHGSITVVAATEGDGDGEHIRLTVRDTGVGIAQDDLQQIFEPFAQVSSSHSMRQQGTGLGLAITRKLVELFGGTLRVESRLGVGTTFTARLPRSGPPRTAAKCLSAGTA